MKLDHIPNDIVLDLLRRGHSSERIAQMTPEQAFDEYCNWHGLIGYGSKLRRAMAAFNDAALP